MTHELFFSFVTVYLISPQGGTLFDNFLWIFQRVYAKKLRHEITQAVWKILISRPDIPPPINALEGVFLFFKLYKPRIQTTV